MKLELVSYVDSENGLSLVILPENEIEQQLLRAFGRQRHGVLEQLNGELRIVWKRCGQEPNASWPEISE